MACLYCGKEIGPIRILRDSEFCTAKHRKEYKERLRKVLLQESEAEAVPTRVAAFAETCVPWDGGPQRAMATFDLPLGNVICIRHSWSLAIPEVLGMSFASVIPAACSIAGDSIRLLPQALRRSLLQLPGPPRVAPVVRLPIPGPAGMDHLCARPDAASYAGAGWLSVGRSESALPDLTLAAAECEVFQSPTGPMAPPARSDDWMPIPAAPVACEVRPRLARELARDNRPLTTAAQQWFPSRDPQGAVPAPCDTWMAGPAAAPVACHIQPRLAGELGTAFEWRFPPLEFPVAAGEESARPVLPPPPCEAWMPSPAAAPVARDIQPRLAGELGIAFEFGLPLLELTAAVCEELVQPVLPPEPCEAWMPSPAAAPVAREVRSLAAGPLTRTQELAIPGELPTPSVGGLAMSQTALTPPAPRPAAREVSARPLLVPLAGIDSQLPGPPPAAGRHLVLGAPFQRYIPIPESEPAVRQVRPSKAHLPLAAQSAPLRLAPFALELAGEALPISAVPQVSLPRMTPMAAETLPSGHSPTAVAPEASVLFHGFQLSPRLSEGVAPAGFESRTPQATAPEACVPNDDAAVLRPISTLRPSIPQTESEPAEPVIPASEFIPLDYHCVRGRGIPRPALGRLAGASAFGIPAFALRPVFDRVEDGRTRPKAPPIAEIIPIVEAGRFRRHAAVQHASKAIAASVLVAIGLWFGTNAARLGRRVINRDASAEAAAVENFAPTVPSSGRPSPARRVTPVAWVKNAVARRAASAVTDNFKGGMEAWGAASKSFAPGWARHPDGYVRPGQLALFRPTINYTDYRLEFFGEIESKGMSWAVRAHDPKNYYAMKFNVVEPGLRPVLAMVHYPVVGGKPGRRTEVPLSIMVHNNTPYHVAVTVSGNRFVTSIEGQEVDSWTDDVLGSGGVGFFSEAGERARLYWMRVSKNDDWLGRVCAFLSGNSIEEPQQTASIERRYPDGGRPGRAPGSQHESPDAIIVSVKDDQVLLAGLQRERAANHGRIRVWSS